MCYNKVNLIGSQGAFFGKDNRECGQNPQLPPQLCEAKCDYATYREGAQGKPPQARIPACERQKGYFGKEIAG